MKILHIATFGVSGKLNGVAQAVLQLATHQKKHGALVKICTFTKHDVIDGDFVNLTPNVKCFKNVCDSFNPDIVSFHSLYEFQQITFSSYLRKKGIPYVLVFHGGASRDNAEKGKVKKIIANFLFWDNFIKKACKVVYLNSQEEQKSVFKKINSNSCIIPNGSSYNINYVVPYKSGPINITFMGRLDYYGKGLDILLPVIKRLRDENVPNVRFSFYGLCLDDTNKLIEDLEPYAQWYGFVQGEDKEKAYAESDVLILPSRSEGMPMCVLEALGYGLPCILTKETNMLEIIEDHQVGWPIELDQESVYNVIKTSVHCLTQNRDAYFSKCRDVARLFSWEKIAKVSLDLYLEVLKKK